MLYHYGNGNTYLDYWNDLGEFFYSEWRTASTGSQIIKYNYTYFPVGANLLNSSGNIAATITNSNNAWHTGKTTISSMSLNPTAYYRFSSFNSQAFDARSYDSQATFRVQFTTYDGTSLNLTSPTSGSYTYNLKWNGTIFTVFLNGSQLGVFDTSDYFLAGANVTFTPETQTDAILVKDVIPKADSQYSLGELGKEFATGYIDNLYAKSVEAGWHMPIITANQTLAEDFTVGTFRPYYVQSSGASGPTITMPGNSTQSYTVFSFRYSVAVVAGASCVARDVVAGGGTLSTSSYVSASQPWCLLFVLRTA